jgi:hypothetical protein
MLDTCNEEGEMGQVARRRRGEPTEAMAKAGAAN